jgi:hypothetical protein
MLAGESQAVMVQKTRWSSGSSEPLRKPGACCTWRFERAAYRPKSGMKKSERTRRRARLTWIIDALVCCLVLRSWAAG